MSIYDDLPELHSGYTWRVEYNAAVEYLVSVYPSTFRWWRRLLNEYPAPVFKVAGRRPGVITRAAQIANDLGLTVKHDA